MSRFPKLATSIVLAVFLVALVSCSKGETAVQPPGNKPAVPAAATPPQEVQKAIESYLTEKGMNPAKMVVTYSSYQESGDTAECGASFSVKEAAGMPPMQYLYSLQKADGGWKVTSSRPKDGAGHAGAPPAGGAAPAGAMPEGHPAIGGANPHAGVPGAPDMSPAHGTAPPQTPDKK